MFSEVKEDEWEELGSDIAALHRLQGLSKHMFDESFMNTSTTRYLMTGTAITTLQLLWVS